MPIAVYPDCASSGGRGVVCVHVVAILKEKDTAEKRPIHAFWKRLYHLWGFMVHHDTHSWSYGCLPTPSMLDIDQLSWPHGVASAAVRGTYIYMYAARTRAGRVCAPGARRSRPLPPCPHQGAGGRARRARSSSGGYYPPAPLLGGFPTPCACPPP